jgi:hypothetical protein
MNSRSLCGLTILGTLLAAPAVRAQSEPADSRPQLAAHILEAKPADSNPSFEPNRVSTNPLELKPKSPVHFSKTRFILLTTAVYGAAIADMHQTMANRNEPWWYETNVLARPFVHLPAPAYYATGLAMATAVNWLSWKIGHSKRWHKFAPIPQLVSIGGNAYGFQSNRF